MAYSFDATRGETADAIKRRREWVQALLNGVGTGAVPTTVGGGIAEIGDALAGLVAKKRSEKMDREGTAAAMKAAGGNSYIQDLLLGNTGGGAEISGTGGANTLSGSAGRDSLAKPFKVSDPVAEDLAPHQKAFLNAISGGESGGAYNVRYTPRGPAYFNDLSQHPGIMEPGPHGKTSASGRYQFTKTTWDGLGGGDFSPANQDHRAWQLAQRDYGARTGRSLDADLQAGGLTPQIMQALTPTWQAFKGNRGRHAATYRDSLGRYSQAPAGTDSLPGGEGNDTLGGGGVIVGDGRPRVPMANGSFAPSGIRPFGPNPLPPDRMMPGGPMQPDPSRFGPATAPTGDRLQPTMQAQGPLTPQGVPMPQMAQGMPQQAPVPQPRPQMAPQQQQVDPMQTAAVQPQMRPRGIVSPRAEENGYTRGPGAAPQNMMPGQGGQGGGLLARLLMRQPMPQPAQGQPVAGTGGAATAQGGGGNDSLMEMYALIDNPYLPESYRAALIDALKQKQEQADPAYQADLAYKQAQTRALENPEPQFIPGKDGSIFRADKKSGNVEQVYGGKPDQPTDVREYEYAKQQGYQGTFNDWQLEQKRAGASSVNIDQKSESAFDTELAKKQAGTFDTMAAEGLNARADLGIINELGTLLQGQGGTFTGVSGALAKYGIGGEGIDDIQAAQALINKLVPTQRSPGSGSMSDRDVELFTRSLPSLWNTPGGNEKILGVMRGLAQYKQAQGEIADMVIMGEMTRQEARQALRKLPNPLAEFAPKGGDGVEVDGYKVREVP